MRSLKKHVIFLTLSLIIAILGVAMIGNKFVRQEQTIFSNNLTDRSIMLDKTHEIKDKIWASHSTLENFLLLPFQKSNSLAFYDALNKSKLSILSLNKFDWYASSEARKDLYALLKTIEDLDQSVSRLIDIRDDSNKQYPAFVMIRTQMLPSNRKFLSSTALALGDLSEEPQRNGSTKKEYDTIQLTRYLWTKMTGTFRILLSNLVGNLDNDAISDQVQDIKIYQYEIDVQIKLLENQSLLHKSRGFLTDESVKIMRTSYNIWTQNLNKVLKIYNSGNWRTDAGYLSEKILPIMNKSWTLIQSIEKSIKKSTEHDLAAITKTSNALINTITLLTIIGILYVLIVYFAVHKIILSPIAKLNKYLSESTNEKNILEMPKQKYSEIQSLQLVFFNMRRQIKERQEQLIHQALHDNLTSLPNRILLLDRLRQLIKDSRRNKTTPGIIILDLDRFKEVNDTLGHDVGDMLLQDVSKRLSNILRELDSIARLGGDEFAVLLHDIDQNGAKIVASKISNALSLPFQVENHQLLIGCSQGIALFPLHGENETELIKHADVAMYVAKRGYLGNAIYNPNEDHNNVKDLSLTADLRSAINNNELKLFYQPKINSESGEVIGTEALLRWIHPEKGFISPEVIVRAAEQSGLINPLTEWVIKNAINQTDQWQKNNINIGVSVNLSAYNLLNPHLVTIIKFMLDDSQLSSDQLTLEITESAMMVNPQLAASVLSLLNNMGLKISIDDFGTGYSSLAYLKNLPVHELKIDRSFVMNIVSSKRDISIVKSTIDLAHNLGLTVVGEGVEDLESWDILHSLGCDVIQGYYISKPMPAEEYESWYTNYSRKLLARKQA